MHSVLVNRLGILSLPRISVVRLTDRSDMTIAVCRGHRATTQHQLSLVKFLSILKLGTKYLVALCEKNQLPPGYQSLYMVIFLSIEIIAVVFLVTDFLVPQFLIFIYILIMDKYKLWERKPR